MLSTTGIQFDIDDIADLIDGTASAMDGGDEGFSVSLMDVIIAIIVNG